MSRMGYLVPPTLKGTPGIKPRMLSEPIPGKVAGALDGWVIVGGTKLGLERRDLGAKFMQIPTLTLRGILTPTSKQWP